MQIKLVAIDLDGTLLRDDMTISAYSKGVIEKIAKQGVHIVIATGRMFDSAQEKTNQLGLGDIPLICYTGSWIMYSQSGKPLVQEGVDAETTKKILAIAKENDWLVHTFYNDQIYLPIPHPSEEMYQKYRSKKVKYLGEKFYYPEEKSTRIIFASPDISLRHQIRNIMEKNFGNEIDVVFPGDDFVDIHKKGINKGWALAKLCNLWNLSKEEVISFGNTENDISMMKFSGQSWAVANADKVALLAADNICDSNEKDGVAHVLESLFIK